uniref:Uncharacterized protein n=1 Tax=Lactuca sativa TaxID=4236 RepID=A0A9R1XP31_LACSA|nr:hypothetical protein LSAT_V11C300126610 [Lactuca sativa]
MDANEQSVDDEVHEGEDNAVNMENVADDFHKGNENVDMRDFEIVDGIKYEGKADTEQESDERSDKSDESHDNEFSLDEDNIISDVEVDMRDFYMNIDLEAEILEKGVTKIRDNENEEDPEEWDVINNDQCNSMDEGFDRERKRRLVLKELGKETRCSQGEIQQITFRYEKNINLKRS